MSRYEDQVTYKKSPLFGGVRMADAVLHKFSYKPHAHDEFAIGAVRKGAKGFRSAGTQWKASEGDLITLNPSEVHDGQSINDSECHYQVIYFEPQLVADVLEELYGKTTDLTFFKSAITHAPEVAKQHQILFNILNDAEYSSRLEQQEHFVQTLATLFTQYAESQKPPQQLKPHWPLIQKVCDYIHAFFHENPSLEDLGRVIGCTSFHCLRLFKATLGVPPHTYLMYCRLEKARQLIQTGMPLLEAALSVGYTDQSHLSRYFKTAYGLTPGAYQKAMQG